jgi:hypothetical protein
MHRRHLGTTGIELSPYCLGAPMFGGSGNPDHDDCVRIVHLGGWRSAQPAVSPGDSASRLIAAPSELGWLSSV